MGISLEGTVDVENGVEKRPHHYIRCVLEDGPVGLNSKLQGGDELLEVSLCVMTMYSWVKLNYRVLTCSLSILYYEK